MTKWNLLLVFVYAINSFSQEPNCDYFLKPMEKHISFVNEKDVYRLDSSVLFSIIKRGVNTVVISRRPISIIVTFYKKRKIVGSWNRSYNCRDCSDREDTLQSVLGEFPQTIKPNILFAVGFQNKQNSLNTGNIPVTFLTNTPDSIYFKIKYKGLIFDNVSCKKSESGFGLRTVIIAR